MKKIVSDSLKLGAFEEVAIHQDHYLADGVIYPFVTLGENHRLEECEASEFFTTPKGEVPRTITKLQCMKQLKKIGKWQALKQLLEANEDANDEWILSDDINRNYPLTQSMGEALELSEEEIDDLFREAQHV